MQLISHGDECIGYFIFNGPLQQEFANKGIPTRTPTSGNSTSSSSGNSSNSSSNQ